MSYLLTDEQTQIRDEARKLLSERYSGAALKALLEDRGAYDQGFWRCCRDMGWTGAAIAEDYGGLGLGLVELCLLAEECGRVTCGAPFLGTSFAAGQAIALYGSAAQRLEWLAPLATGAIIGTLAFAERSQIAPRSPTVRFSDGKLFGGKTAVTAGAVAHLAIVLATDDLGAPILAIADLRQATVRRETLETVDNSRCAADLRFDGASAQPMTAGDGRAAAPAILGRYALVVAAEQVGGAEACMERARDYANERHAFGQPIGKFQAVKHSIAELYVLIQIARANVMEAALSVAESRADFPALAAAARVSATEAYEASARQTTQIHGGIGVTWESDIHLHYRRSRMLALECGSVPFWEDRLVDMLAQHHDR